MAFQPFGYKFEIISPAMPSVVKEAIRSRKKRWFDPKNGARGWIVGPIICLWFSAFDQQGPMLFGRICSDNFGTKISGRAGSDLNGLAMVSLTMPVLAICLYQVIPAGNLNWRQSVVLGALISIGVLFFAGVFWMFHMNRRDAEPLVRFLRDVVTVPGRSVGAKSAGASISCALTLDVGGEDREGPVTPEAIHDALLEAGADDFVILHSAPETYIQTASQNGGFVIEMRQGDQLRHFQAARVDIAPTSTDGARHVFTFEETLAAFLAYGSETEMPYSLRWEPMSLR